MTAAERNAAIVARTATIRVGDKVRCVYGDACEVIKLNKKSVLIKGQIAPIKLDRHLIINFWHV